MYTGTQFRQPRAVIILGASTPHTFSVEQNLYILLY